MSKWNKQNSQPLSQEFIQNEERRKQMIIQAAKRRKEKEKKVQQQQEAKRKADEQALLKHKQQKKETYVKYLKSNIHDKYEQLKKKKKQQQPEIKPMAKWKKKSAQKQQKNNNFQSEVTNPKCQHKTISQFSSKAIQQPPKNVSNRKKVKEQFQFEWQFSMDAKDELINSKLLDSLDLDIGTIKRQRQMKQIMKQNPKNNDIKQLRDLIGYQSTVFNKNNHIKQQPQIQQPQDKKLQVKKNIKKNETNQVEMMNQLKNKKEAKMLNWAINQEQQAQDLFSQCSSINKKKSSKALKQLNDDIRNKKVLPIKKNQQLQTIKQIQKQKAFNKSKQKLVNREVKIQQTNSNKNITKDKSVEKNNQKNNSKIDKKNNITQPNFGKISQEKNQNKTASVLNYNNQKMQQKPRSTSQEKSRQSFSKQKRQEVVKPQKVESLKPLISKPQPKAKIFGNLPPLPVSKIQNNSIATHDMQIDLQSFIKQDLVNLNEQQRKLQQQLKDIHKNNKDRVKQVYNKYEIKNDYKYSAQVLGQQSKPKPYKYYQNQVQIQDSIQNLNNYLIRRQLQSKDRNRTIHQQIEQESSKSLIDPFSNSKDLCNQVLMLAKNISRFEKKDNNDENNNGYGYMNKIKRNSSGNKLADNSKVSKNNSKNKPQQDTQMLSESRDVSQISQPLARPPFIFEVSQINSKMYKQQQKSNEKPQKIHVNKDLLKGLLLDDQ